MRNRPPMSIGVLYPGVRIADLLRRWGPESCVWEACKISPDNSFLMYVMIDETHSFSELAISCQSFQAHDGSTESGVFPRMASITLAKTAITNSMIFRITRFLYL